VLYAGDKLTKCLQMVELRVDEEKQEAFHCFHKKMKQLF